MSVNVSEWEVTTVRVLDIRRRFKRGRAHLVDDYLPLATRWAIWIAGRYPGKGLATSAADAIDPFGNKINQ